MNEEREQLRAKVPYVYQVTFSSVAAGSTSYSSPAIQIGARPFVWTHIAMYSEGDQDFSILITDNTVSQNFMNIRIMHKAISRTGSRPFELPVPWRFEANSSIYMEVRNEGTAADTLHVLLIGYLD